MYYVQVLVNGQWHNLLGYPPTGWAEAVERHCDYVCTYRHTDYRIVAA